jgi:hypothetical protein
VASTIWLSSLLWGQIYTAALQNFNNTAVRLFGVKQAAPTRREQVGKGIVLITRTKTYSIDVIAGHSKRLKQVAVVCQWIPRTDEYGDPQWPAIHVRHVIMVCIA